MMNAPRVLNKRTDFIPPDAVYVGRPSKWGNPYAIGDSKFMKGIVTGLGEKDEMSRQEVVAQYEWRLFYTEIGATLRQQIGELKGKDLVCWCSPEACHADVLLKLANK